jgi:peptidoglycan hydrolase-like protein with peptidoglycan-binding domain
MKPKLEYAAHGPFVIEAQTKLNTLMPEAQPPLKVDGKYFDATVARVKLFQKTRGLMPDGVVGGKTWAALDGGAPAVTTAAGPSASGTQPGSLNAHLVGQKAHAGASIRCDLGTRHSVLILPAGQPATAGDCKQYVNILPFGQCKSHLHPQYVADARYEDPYIENLSFQYSTKPKNRPACTPAITTPWMGGVKQPGHLIDSTLVIDKRAKCNCSYGGTIRFN